MPRDLRALGTALAGDRLPLAGWSRANGRIAALVVPLVMGTLVVGADAGLFLRRDAQFSMAGIACFDTTMRARLARTRALFPPGETLIFAAGYYQHVRTSLPAYRAWLYAPDDPASCARAIPAGTRYLLVFDEEAHPATRQTAFAHFILPCNGVPFWYATVRAGDVARYDPATDTIAVERP